MAEQRSILERYPDYECVIGIEVHVQLNTASKIFCSCANKPSQEPNSTICQICAGYPGTLPVLNKEVVHNAILAGLATNCEITSESYFARKHYFYPDLPKGYQITQSDTPICTNGSVSIRLPDGSLKKIRLMRIHIEEDAGKNIHATTGESFVDLNRAGTPLLEIVSQPDISNATEAKAYLKALRQIIVYLGISSGNMQEGAFRADTNISIRRKGDPKLGTRVELKNINSFKYIGDAIEYEIGRQIEVLESGQKVKQETRLWDQQTTKAMRSKEDAADYRYFTEPDLPPIISKLFNIEAIKAAMPELPHARFERFMQEYGVSAYEAEILLDEPAIAHYFEAAAKLTSSKQLKNWIIRDLLAHLKESNTAIEHSKMTPARIAQLMDLLESSTINNRAAQEIFAEVLKSDKDPKVLVKELGLEQMDNAAELEAIIKELIAQNPGQTAEYKAGKQKLFGYFVGLAMAKTQGKGNPKTIQELLKKHLA
jgi:aspartyl-tRNA(Asn)/glutamyl-tRNA(Gln) amidotransferase subunit B